MDTLLQDLRYGLRQLRKTPAFTTIAVLTLALGIAVNATMFSLVSAFLLRRPPGREPDRVVVVSSINPTSDFHPDASPVSRPNYLAWREANHVFEDMAASDDGRTVSLTARRQSEAIPASAVSANYFDVLGVTAQFGRTFQSGDDKPASEHTVVLSHELWEREFGSDPSVVGRVIRLDREDYTVIGVMAPSFRLMGYPSQLWIPLVITPADQTAAARRNHSLRLFARLKPGVTLDQARAEMVIFARRAEENFPDTEKGWGAAVRTLPDFLIYDFDIRNGILLIMTTVGFILMIACANVAGLLLARSAARKKEIAVRVSLGAGRLRIVRQLLTEGLLLALLGGSLGLLFAYWGIQFLRASLLFNDAISAVALGLDANVLIFSTVISLLCAVLCGLAPALRASRSDVTSGLKDEGRGSTAGRSQGRLRTVMVTGEIALALFLLVGSGLLFLAIFRIEHQNLGFQSDHLLTAGLTLDAAHYKDSAQQLTFVRNLIPRLAQIPGADSVAVTSDLPATGPGTVILHIAGRADPPAGSRGFTAIDSVVTPDFFRAGGISLLRGRTFTESDSVSAPLVVLVNQKFVDRYYPGSDAIGKQIRLEVNGMNLGETNSSATRWSQIIGVVSNVKTFSENTTDDPEIYEAFFQRPLSSFSVMIRSASDPDGLASALRGAVAQIDPELPLAHVMSMTTVIDRQKYGNPFMANIMIGFATLALILAAIGIYGLIAYSVGQRIHEIGIRMAMGAGRSDVMRMIFREGMKITLIGGIVGIALSLPLPRVFSAIFEGFNISEPRLYLIVPVAIFIVATISTYVPALRAARVEPMTALRQG